MSSGLSDTLRDLANSQDSASSPPSRPATSQGPRNTRHARNRRKKKPSPLLVAMVPALLVVATIALALAVWGTLVLTGAHVWRSEAPKAAVMAKAMLAAYPVALCLYAGAIYFALQGRG